MIPSYGIALLIIRKLRKITLMVSFSFLLGANIIIEFSSKYILEDMLQT